MICHLLTAPYSPPTGKVERLHKTMRAEFFTPRDGTFAAIPELQAALDGWVAEYNTARPHQSCGGSLQPSGSSSPAGPSPLTTPPQRRRRRDLPRL